MPVRLRGIRVRARARVCVRRRIVLDEAHTIRNRKTKTHRACLRLRGRFRWCLTGTPLQNHADDAQPLFAFLRAQPLDEWSVWTRAVGRPIRDGDEAGLALLRLVLRSVSLRRTKEILAGQIPEKVVEIHRIVRGCFRGVVFPVFPLAQFCPLPALAELLAVTLFRVSAMCRRDFLFFLPVFI